MIQKYLNSKVILLFLILNTSLFIITLSLSFAILFRPFYYYHINYLKLEEETNSSYNEIKTAYDDVIDYIVMNKPFKTGNLKFSVEGKNHFMDCKRLFKTNFIVLGISLAILLLEIIIFKNKNPLKHSIAFYSSCSILILFGSILFTTLIIGFEKSFILFHKIFFLGKDNWLLDPNTDEIINILPEEYFKNCALLIISFIILISVSIVIIDLLQRKK